MSDMLRDGLKARLPMIRVTTNDPVSVEQVLQSIAGTKHTLHIEGISPASLYKVDTLLWTDSVKCCTTDNWETLNNKDKTLVFVNVPASDLLFDAGELLPPQALVQAKVAEYTNTSNIAPILTGLSLKAVDELLRLTSVKFGNLLPVSIKSMRAFLNKPVTGLVPVDTSQKLYFPHKPLEAWTTTSKPYFLSEVACAELRPRGILLYGGPGTGKTGASKYIANAMGVPLYRLDISSSLNKYIGASESNMARVLSQIEDFAPAVLLIDEIEKLFISDSDSGVTQRLLSQLLWWLSEHQSQVLTVMTTNNRSKIPPELFREGRIDLQMEIPDLTPQQATALGHAYMKYLLGGTISMKQATSVQFMGSENLPAVKVLTHVVSVIKSAGWGLKK